MSSNYADLADDEYDQDGYDDWRDYDEDDEDDDYEPDPEDAEIARSYAEHYEHCERKHGGGECDCRPSRLMLGLSAARTKAERLCWDARTKVTAPLWQPVTVRIGPAEITLRVRPDRRRCCCSGRGWFYTKTGEPDTRPEGYDGVGLCGCGAAIAKLADDRRATRQAQSEPPF